MKFFEAIKKAVGKIDIVAEDLVSTDRGWYLPLPRTRSRHQVSLRSSEIDVYLKFLKFAWLS